MRELLALYAWTLAGGVAFAAALAVLGGQLAARGRAFQTLCVSQGSMLGALLALGLFGANAHEAPGGHTAHWVLAFLVAALVYFGSEAMARRFSAQGRESALFASTFALLTSLSAVTAAFFPQLETHLTQMYFGDLATLTVGDSKLTVAVGCLALLALAAKLRAFTGEGFGRMVLGRRSSELALSLASLSLVAYGVHFLGLLFTITTLFLPTTLLSFSARAGLRRHAVLSVTVVVLGVVAGFLLSLAETRLPTVPAIALAVAVLSVGALLLTKILAKCGF